MSLNAQMRAFRNAFEAAAPRDLLGAFRRAETALRHSEILEGALKAGDPMPEFTLPDASGYTVALAALLKRGPVVVSFYRGDWCDYCAMELAALNAIHPQMKGYGATLVAISPQEPSARVRSGSFEPSFPMLFDSGAKVARRCGIAFELFEELRPIYTEAGRRPLPGEQDSWLLPLPATYVVDWTGEIALSFLDTDYTRRLEPANIITVLSHLDSRSVSRRPLRIRGAAPKGAR